MPKSWFKLMRPLVEAKASSSNDMTRHMVQAMKEDPDKDIYFCGADQNFEATMWTQMLLSPSIFARWVGCHECSVQHLCSMH